MSESNKNKIREAEWISLAEDEEVKIWSHKSIYPYIGGYISGILIILFGFFSPFVFNLSGLLVFTPLIAILIGLLIIAVEYIRYVSVFYIFTDNRAIKKYGILTQNVKKVSYNDIEKLDKRFPLIGRILNFGTITLVTATPDEDDLKMKFLPKPSRGADIIGEYESELSKSMRNN